MQDGEHEHAIRDEHVGNGRQHATEVVDVGQPVVAHNNVVGAGRQPDRSTGVLAEVRDSLRVLILVKPGTLDQFRRDIDTRDDLTSPSEFSCDSAMTAGKIEDSAPSNIAGEVEKGNRRRIFDAVTEQINIEVRDCVVSG